MQLAFFIELSMEKKRQPVDSFMSPLFAKESINFPPPTSSSHL